MTGGRWHVAIVDASRRDEIHVSVLHPEVCAAQIATFSMVEWGCDVALDIDAVGYEGLFPGFASGRHPPESGWYFFRLIFERIPTLDGDDWTSYHEVVRVGPPLR